MKDNPFSQLLAQLNARSRRAPLSEHIRPQRPATKTGAMRDYLRTHGKATVAELAMEADVDNTGLVWALLKADIAKGRI